MFDATTIPVRATDRPAEAAEARMASLLEASLREAVDGWPGDGLWLTGGGRLRGGLALAAGRALAVPERERVAMATCCELLHSASLIHDDLQDRDTMRRGGPSFWASHGAERAICAGDLLLSAAYGKLSELRDAGAALRLVHTAVATTIAGQVDDLDAGPAPVPTAWASVARRKAGPLLALPLQLPLLAAGLGGSVGAAGRVAGDFAVAYQALDDLDDAACDAAARRPNLAVSAGRGATARLAAEHLDRAAAGAADLPRGAGQALRVRATRLRERCHAA
jgi:geranylgeranyl diphosphate synthase type II